MLRLSWVADKAYGGSDHEDSWSFPMPLLWYFVLTLWLASVFIRCFVSRSYRLRLVIEELKVADYNMDTVLQCGPAIRLIYRRKGQADEKSDENKQTKMT